MRARVGFRLVADANHRDLAALAVGKNTGLALVMMIARLALRARAAKLAAHRLAFIAPDMIAPAVALAWLLIFALARRRFVGTNARLGIPLAFVASGSRAPIVLPGRRRHVLRARPRHDRSGKIRPCLGRDACAELLAQMPGRDFGNRAFREFAELERSVRHADQAVDRESERAQNVAHLAVLAFAH